MKPPALAVAISLLLAGSFGCAAQPDSRHGQNVGPGNPGSDSYGCQDDADCAYPGAEGPICARDGECLRADEVRVGHVEWTVSGQPASAAACAAAPDLELLFLAGGVNEFGYSPVPCAEGEFTVDKLPVAEYYGASTGVTIERAGDYESGVDDGYGYAVFDVTAAPDTTVVVDLPY
jgi:hypothetical protein